MSGATFSDVSTYGNMKELYDADSYFQENVMSSLRKFMRHDDSVEYDGQNWNVATVLQVNTSYAGLNDGERLPEAQIQKGVFAKYRAKQSYQTIEATTFAATRGHKNGRVSGKYMDDLIKGSMLAFDANLDFDLYANGRGYRATIATATAAQDNFTCTSTMRLMPGSVFDWYDATMTTKRGSIQISIKSVDRMNRRVYIESTFGTGAVPAGAVAGDILCVYGAMDAGEPSDGRYIAGFDRMLDNTISLGTLTASQYAAWSATNVNASGANPSQELLQLFWDSMYQISQRYPDKMVFNPALKRSYLNQFLGQRRFTNNTFDTGASTLTFSPLKMGTDEKGRKPKTVQMLEDKNALADRFLLWCDECVAVASDYASEPHLADEDGKDFRFRLGYDSMQGFTRFWWNTVVTQRNAMGMLYGFATPSGVL